MSASLHAQRPFSRIVLLVAGVLLLAVPASPARAQTLDPRTWVPDSYVNGMAVEGDLLYLGGSFQYLGPPNGGGAPVSFGGQVDPDMPVISGYVHAAVSDGAGGWFVGGEFDSVGLVPRRNLAHVDANLVLTAWSPQANGIVRALELGGGDVYVGGYFDSISGERRTGLAAVNAISGAVSPTNLSLEFEGGPGYVETLEAKDGILYVGGFFAEIAGEPRNSLAAVELATGDVTGWTPATLGGGVPSLAVGDTVVYVADIGRVTAIGVSPAAPIVWNVNVGGPGSQTVVAFGSGTVYTGGTFASVGGQPRTRVAAIDAATGTVLPWNPGASFTVTALHVRDGLVYVGGNFHTFAGQTRVRLAAADAVTGALSAWSPGSFGQARVITSDEQGLFIGGFFLSLGGVTRDRLAAIDLRTGAATDWNPGANNSVFALAIRKGVVYAGGTFTSTAGVPRRGLAAFDADGTVLPWDPGSSSILRCIVPGEAGIFVGGGFDSLGGQLRRNIAMLDPITGAAMSWNPNASSAVQAIVVDGNTVYAGGSFTSIGGATRGRIAALDATTGLATSWNPNADVIVNALALEGNTIYAGGSFTSIGGQPRNLLAAIDRTTGLASPWNPNLVDEGGGGAVFALTVAQTGVVAGGSFDLVGGVPRNGLTAIDRQSGAPTDWNPLIAQNQTRLLAVSPGRLHVAADGFHRLATYYDGVVGVPFGVRPSGLRLAIQGSNPSRGVVRLGFELPRRGEVELSIYDLRGRRVRSFESGILSGGMHSIAWDGRDDSGRAVSSGVYFARLATDDGVGTARLVRLAEE